MLLSLPNLTGIDLIIAIVLAAGLLTGFMKGVIKQAFSLGGLVAGLLLGSVLSKPVAGLLLQSFRMSEKTAVIVAFVLILMIIPLAFTLLGGLLSKVMKAAKLGFADRLLGGLFGMLKFAIFIGLCIQLLEYTGFSDKFINQDEERQSKFYEPVRNVTDKCLHWAWDKVLEQKAQLESALEESEQCE